MSQLLSRQIDEALKAIDATPNPTREQLLELVGGQRELLLHAQRFAQDIEQAHRVYPGTVPMVAASTAAARLYRDLAAAGTEVPDQDGKVIRMDFGGRA